MKNKIVEAFLKFVSTAEGKKVFDEIYGCTELKKASNSDYLQMRALFDELRDITGKMIN